MRRIIFLVIVAGVSLGGCQADSTNVTGNGDAVATVSSKMPEAAGAKELDDSSPSQDQDVRNQPYTPEPVEGGEVSDEKNKHDVEQANANVIFVKVQLGSEGTWTFFVTVEHPDTGWEDYADGWDVVLPTGGVVKSDPESPFTRLILHPHETEQPFTRSQSGIEIPPDVEQVTVRAHDLVAGFGGSEVVVNLMVDSGPSFEVVR